MKLYVLPGDGIGPEIVEVATTILKAAEEVYDVSFEFTFDDVGLQSLKDYGTTLRDETIEKATSFDGVILGPQSHLDYPSPEQGGHNISAAFRTKLDLYANIRPAKARPTIECKSPEMDLIIVREATEGFYPDRNMAQGWGEFMPSDGMALSVRKITSDGSRRIAQKAFELASRRRQKVTAVHKANSFHMTDGLFLKEVRDVATQFPDVELEEVLVDAMAAYLVRDASRFDVVVATNFYGDILSDLASELAGGLGLAGSIMANNDLCCAQAQHGSAPDIANKDLANPTSMILSTIMLLAWQAEKTNNDELLTVAQAIETAVEQALVNPETRTKDIGGSLGCFAFGNVVKKNIFSKNT